MKTLFNIVGFTSYILIVFLNAMTDLGHKIILQNTIFKSFDGSELIILTAIINALILLPFILLFIPAGSISDKYPKTKVIKIASFIAIIITTMILISYYNGWFYVAFGLTLILSAQSAIYSPAKYGLIKELVGRDKLAIGNAFVQSVTIVSILLGSVVYSIFFETLLDNSASTPSDILQVIYPLAYLLVGASILEFILSMRLDKTHKNIEIKSPIEKPTISSNIKILTQNKTIWLSIVGLSILWGVSQILLAIFGEYLKTNFNITNTIVAQGMLTISGIGIVIGSLMAGKISKNYIETGSIPLGAFGVAVSLLYISLSDDLYLTSIALFGFGFFAGIFIVPLNSMIQFSAKDEDLGKVLAGNNLIQNIVMFTFLIITALFGYLNLSSQILLYAISIIAFLGMGYTFIKLPQSMIRYIIASIIGIKYSVKVDGLDNINPNKGTLLLGNHISFLDWAIIQIAYPSQIRFVMERGFYEKWYLKPFLKFFGVIPISQRGSKEALKEVTKALNNGDIVALFPEGYISKNGHLGKFLRGFEIALRDVNSDIDIVPFYIRGLWSDTFSKASKKLRRKKIKDVGIIFGKAMDKNSKSFEVKKAITELSIHSWIDYSSTLPSVQKAWIYGAKESGFNMSVADSTGLKLSGYKFITASIMVASKIKAKIQNQQNIGIILPTSVAGYIANISTLTLGKTIVNLNYTSTKENLKYAINSANISTIITSKKFVQKLKAKGYDIEDTIKDVELIYMEDIKKEKIKSLFLYLSVIILPTYILNLLFIKESKIDDVASILFSSGSEGRPKGILLTHQNIVGNIKQTISVLNPNDDDIMLGTLPIFHSFGLTVTTLLPLIENIPVVCHFDPTDSFAIGKLSLKYKATILFATASIFRIYTKNNKLHPLMFQHLRLVVAGAERLPQKIADEFKNKFGHTLYQGYGATETTPVASVNIPDVLLDNYKVQQGNKENTVGLAIIGTRFKIVNPNTFEELKTDEEGMILIGGTQIMKSYLNNEDKTKEVIKEIDSIKWYVTGDKGKIDEDGFLTIIDRYSRFAKIAGEMISLGLVEIELSKILDENEDIAVSAIRDEKKGEKIVLLLKSQQDIETFKTKVKTLKLNPLYLPSKYIKVEEIPKLGTGKTDFTEVKKLCMSGE